MAELNLVEAVNHALAYEMEHDPAVLVLGEDVGVNGGCSALPSACRRASARAGARHPLAETAIAGTAIGMAAMGAQAGGRDPVLGLHLPDHRSHRQSRLAAAQSHPRPAVLSDGVAHALGRRHPRARASLREPGGLVLNVPGLRVVVPSSPQRAYGLLLAAIRDPDPVIFLEPTRLYRLFKQEVADDGEALLLDVLYPARRQRHHPGELGRDPPGSAGRADLLAAEGVMAEVLDVATLKPLDMETILESVTRTGRCVIVHEAAQTGGFGAEIAAGLAEHGLYSLLAPVRRVAAYDVVVPLARLESPYLPSVERIVDAVRRKPWSVMKVFKLPDLGEGCRKRRSSSGTSRSVTKSRPTSRSGVGGTAKAIVDIPSPQKGRIEKLFGKTGQIVHVGAPLVGFEGSGEDSDAGTVVARSRSATSCSRTHRPRSVAARQPSRRSRRCGRWRASSMSSSRW